MNREAIERLAIDSVAGELNEDAETMLQFYLDEHPQAKHWAEDVRQVYGQTEAAIQKKTAHTNGERIIPRISLVSRAKWVPAVRWAAAIVFGVIFGFSAGRWEVTHKTPTIDFQEPSRISKPVETVSDLKQKYAGTFWGDKMLAMLEHHPKADLRDIRSWDTYRQYVKERHHE